MFPFTRKSKDNDTTNDDSQNHSTTQSQGMFSTPAPDVNKDKVETQDSSGTPESTPPSPQVNNTANNADSHGEEKPQDKSDKEKTSSWFGFVDDENNEDNEKGTQDDSSDDNEDESHDAPQYADDDEELSQMEKWLGDSSGNDEVDASHDENDEEPTPVPAEEHNTQLAKQEYEAESQDDELTPIPAEEHNTQLAKQEYESENRDDDEEDDEDNKDDEELTPIPAEEHNTHIAKQEYEAENQDAVDSDAPTEAVVRESKTEKNDNSSRNKNNHSIGSIVIVAADGKDNKRAALSVYTENKDVYVVDMTKDKTAYDILPQSAQPQFIYLPEGEEHSYLDTRTIVAEASQTPGSVIVIDGAGHLATRVSEDVFPRGSQGYNIVIDYLSLIHI